MTYIDWMFLPLKRYADFSGRSQRVGYWMFSLFNLLLFGGLFLIGGLVGAFDERGGNILGMIVIGLIIVTILAVIVPTIAVTVRRFHDQDRSGWFYLLSFAPYVGGLILVVFMCIDGTPGSNRFGLNPKTGGADIFS